MSWHWPGNPYKVLSTWTWFIKIQQRISITLILLLLSIKYVYLRFEKVEEWGKLYQEHLVYSVSGWWGKDTKASVDHAVVAVELEACGDLRLWISSRGSVYLLSILAIPLQLWPFIFSRIKITLWVLPPRRRHASDVPFWSLSPFLFQTGWAESQTWTWGIQSPCYTL